MPNAEQSPAADPPRDGFLWAMVAPGAGLLNFPVRSLEQAMRTTCNRCGKTVGSPVAVGWVTTAFPAAAVTGLLCGLLLPVSSWFLLAVLPLSAVRRSRLGASAV
jgi:hypothetical protein